MKSTCFGRLGIVPTSVEGVSEKAASPAVLKSRALDSHPVNTKDRGRCKKGTYMDPARTRDQEGSVAQQGEPMSTSQQIDHLLD